MVGESARDSQGSRVSRVSFLALGDRVFRFFVYRVVDVVESYRARMIGYPGGISENGAHSLLDEPFVRIKLYSYHVRNVLNLLDFREIDSLGVPELSEVSADLLRVYINRHSNTISVSLIIRPLIFFVIYVILSRVFRGARGRERKPRLSSFESESEKNLAEKILSEKIFNERIPN